MAACNQRVPWSHVKQLREIYDRGEATPRQLATQFKISLSYVYALIHGEARQSEKARRPQFVTEPMLIRQRIKDPNGNAFIQRVGRPSRFRIQIPWKVVCAIRYAVKHAGMSISDVAVKFGCSRMTVRRIIKNQTRILK